MTRMIALSIASAILIGCGGSGSSSKPPAPIPGPENLTVTNDAVEVTAQWDAVEGAERYDLYYAHEPITDLENYAAHPGGTWLQDVMPPITFTVDDPAPVYHVAVTATLGNRESLPSSSQPAIVRYQINGDGSTVTDLTTGWIWDRCLHGQTWNANTQKCDGDVLYPTVPEANAAATEAGKLTPALGPQKTLIFCSSGQPEYFPHNANDALYNPRCEGDFDTPTIHPLFQQENHSLLHQTTTICGSGTYYRIDFKEGRHSGICAGASGNGPIRLRAISDP